MPAKTPRQYTAVSVFRAGSFASTTLVRSEGRFPTLAVQKRLVPRFRDDLAAQARLKGEGSVLAALGGRSAPRLLGEGDDDLGPWVLLERVSLQPLEARMAAWVEDRQRARTTAHPSACAFVSRLVPAAFAALGELHEASDATGPLLVVHGDITPDNLLASDDAHSVVFVDFGLSHFRDFPEEGAGVFRGTARYVAPEVARGEPASAASDVFSLGLTLLHAASGEPARTDASLASMIDRAGSEPVLAYATRAGKGLVPEHAAFLARCVAFAPEDRPSAAHGASLSGP
jgi:serine/threonine protein kinase